MPLGASHVLVLLMLLVSFHPQRLKALAAASNFKMSSFLPTGRLDLFNLAFWVILLFEVALWIEMLTGGRSRFSAKSNGWTIRGNSEAFSTDD
ncbi:hypothetical protein ACQ5SK_03240 [Bradyrhizobium japonicum]